MVEKYNFFILEVLKAWIDPSKKDPRTIHHRGKGMFMVDGRTIKLDSKRAFRVRSCFLRYHVLSGEKRRYDDILKGA
jgi:hypothetical protein